MKRVIPSDVTRQKRSDEWRGIGWDCKRLDLTDEWGIVGFRG